MSTLGIGTYGTKKAFLPGEIISGKAMWILDKPAEAVEIRLFWYTRGKGTEDVRVVDSRRIDAPGVKSEVEFEFAAPDQPYSFSGKLISLLWAVEVVALPSNQAERFEIVVSPTGAEIVLPQGNPGTGKRV